MTRTVWTVVLGLAVIAAFPVTRRGVDARQGDPLVTVVITLRTPPAAARALSEAAAEAAARAGRAPADPVEADVARGQRTNQLRARLDMATASVRRTVEEAVRQGGGETLYSLAYPAVVVARVPDSALDELRGLPDVAAVEPDTVEQAHLDIMSSTMLASTFWQQGLTGGATDVGVLDSGLYAGHPAFAARAASIGSGVFHGAAQTYYDYCDSPGDPTDLAGHGTWVAGVVFSQGDATYPAKRGISYGIDRFYNLKAAFHACSGSAYMMGSDRMAAVDAALTWPDPPEVFNYSYGATASADDDFGSRFWDAIVDGYQKVVAVSAGNSGPSTPSVGSPGIAYNVLSVANVQDRRTVSRSDDAIATSSSRGPTIGGRKKPDVAAPGTSIVMPAHTGGWSAASGTSFAAPAVAGAAALIIDAGISDPRAVKALLINSADDWGPAGWDASYGWGYVNLSRAYAQLGHVALATLTFGGDVRYFASDEVATIKATATWNRHAAYTIGGSQPGTATLNNIDLALYAATDGSLRSVSASTIDNVEQVINASPEPSVVAVRSTGAFFGASETIALAHSGGLQPRVGPQLVATLAAPPIVGAGELFPVVATLMNPGDVRGHSNQATLSLPTGYVLVAGANPRAVGTLAAGEATTVEWTVRAPLLPDPLGVLVVNASAAAYGSTWQSSATTTTITTGSCGPALSVWPRTFTWHGGEGTATVTVSPGCGWTLQSDQGWVTFPDGASGNGSVTVRFLVPAQTASATRVATLSLGAVSVTILEGGRPSTAHRTDFDGSGRDHLALFRPATAEWIVEAGAPGAFGALGDRPVPGDYDGDRVADRATYRPADSTWRIRRSSDLVVTTIVWGTRGDIPVPGDYNGDGMLELAVFRPSSVSWLIRGVGTIVYGAVGDVPVPGDYNGDGRSEAAVFRPATSAWFVRGMTAVVYGAIGDRPVPADYDGDARTDYAVFRPSTGRWFVRGGETTLLGLAGDVAAPQDVDGDGRAEPAVFRPSTATWHSLNTATGISLSMSIGQTGDVVAAPAPGVPAALAADSDGDRRSDLAVFSPSIASWSTRRSSDLAVHTRYYGAPGDMPVPGDYLGTGTEQDAVYRPSTGAWFIAGGPAIVFGGGADDQPAPADYDGDGRLDLAVFRPSTSRWYILSSGSGFRTVTSKVFGGPGDTPLPGDYDGDGRADVALFREANAQWWVLRSSDDQVAGWWFGNPGDRPVPADHDGDGRVDLAVYRQSTGRWFVWPSSTGAVVPFTLAGNPEDVPLSFDYDGDGRANIALYRPALRQWDVLDLFSTIFGEAGDLPTRTR